MTIRRYDWGEEEGTGGSGGAAADVTYSEAVSKLGVDNVQDAIDLIYPQEVRQTTQVLTYYVRTTGNDANTGLTIGDALLTIQAAIEKIPKHINHNVTVDIGAGNFAGFYVTTFVERRGVRFTIQGTFGAPTLTTGTTSGTATGGSTTQCIDAGQTWTTNELRGRLVYVNGDYRVIRNNNGTTLNLIGPSSSTCSGKVYSLVEQKTIIDSPSLLAATTTVRVLTFSNLIPRFDTYSGLIIADLKLTGGSYGTYSHDTAGILLRRIHASGASVAGIGCQMITGEMQWQDCYATGNTSYGFMSLELGMMHRFWRVYSYANGLGFFLNGPGSYPSTNVDMYADNNTTDGIRVGANAEFYITRLFSENNGGYGISTFSHSFIIRIADGTVTANGAGGVYFGSGAMTIAGSSMVSGNTGYGIDIGGYQSASGNDLTSGTLNVASPVVISGNTLGGIRAKRKSVLVLAGVSGSNTGYGVTLETDSAAEITVATTITGSTGDAIIDAGATTLTWLTDFATDGDSVTNARNGCNITRKD